MDVRFEAAFLKSLKKHASIKALVKRKVDMIIADPLRVGEPLKGSRRGFYSAPVSRNFIIYLYCESCRKKGDASFVACADCADMPDRALRFILLGPHDTAYKKQSKT